MQTPFDELDQKIIDRLFVDARSSNREIAREFGLTEGSIRARLKRLLEAKAIRGHQREISAQPGAGVFVD